MCQNVIAIVARNFFNFFLKKYCDYNCDCDCDFEKCEKPIFYFWKWNATIVHNFVCVAFGILECNIFELAYHLHQGNFGICKAY